MDVHTKWLATVGGDQENQSTHLKRYFWVRFEYESLEFGNAAICEVESAILLLPPRDTLQDDKRRVGKGD